MYRKSHVITASAGAGTNYQTGIKVYKTTGTDGTEVINGITAGKIYVGSNCRNDFGDIRFTDNDGDTLLDYWLDPDYLVSGTSAVFWVEVADTLESNATIYVYYSKSDATDASNGDNTFLLFDHFDNASLDPAKWTKVEIGGGLVSEPAGTAALLDVHPSVSNDKAGIKSVATFTSNIAFLVKRKQTAEHGYYVIMALGAGGTCGSAQQDALKSGYQWRQYEPANATGTNGLFEYSAAGVESAVAISGIINGDNDAYHIYEARYYGATGILDFLVDGVSKKSGADTTFLANAKNFLVSQGSYNGGAYGQDTYVDYVIARKFIATEPAHGAWGTEESSGGVAHYLTITESLGGLDSISRTKSYFRTITESLGLLSWRHRLMVITELMGTLDTISQHRWRNAKKTITEILGMLDTKSRKKAYKRIVTELLGLKDTHSRGNKWIHRTIVELLGAKDTRSKKKVIHRTITELLGTLESQTHSRHLKRIITEIMGMVERVMGDGTVKHYDKPRQEVENWS